MDTSAWSRRRGWAQGAAIAWGLAACDVPLPTPPLVLAPNVSPAFVCNASNEANRARQTRVTLAPAAGTAFFLATSLSLTGVRTGIPAVSLRNAAGVELLLRSVELATPGEMAFWVTATTDRGAPLGPGDYTVLVRDAPGRVTTTAQGALHIVAPPEIFTVERADTGSDGPATLCAQGVTRLRVRGRGFRAGAMVATLLGDGTPPVVLENGETTVVSPEVIELTISGRGLKGRFGLRLTALDGSRNPSVPAALSGWPQGCEATRRDALVVVPSPTLSAVEGDERCGGGAVSLVVRGELLGEGDAFALGAEGDVTPDAVAYDLPASDGTFRRATLTVDASRLRGRSPYPITLRARGGCSATLDVACPSGAALDAEGRCARTIAARGVTAYPPATIVSPPRVEAVIAPRACAAGAYGVMVRGANFFAPNGEAPRVTLGGLNARSVFRASTTELFGEFELPAEWLRGDATRTFQVTTATGCATDHPVSIRTRAATFDALLPTTACRGAEPVHLTLRGSGLGGLEGATPPVDVGGLAADVRRVGADELDVTLSPMTPTGVDLDVVVGERDGCELRRAGFSLAAPMQIARTFAVRACDDGELSAIVRADDLARAPPAFVFDEEPIVPTAVAPMSPQALRVSLPRGLAPGAHTLAWRASNGCGEGASRVEWSPPEGDATLDTVTPAVVSRVAPARLRIQGTAVAAFRSFALVGAGAAGASLPLTDIEAVDADTVLATVPSGATAGGPYALEATDGPCRATLLRGVAVTAAAGLTVDALTPATVERATAARVVVYGSGWTTPPRLHLTRDGSRVEVTPIALRPGRVAFEVPLSLAEGTYALALSTPDGRGATAPAALHVVARAPHVTALTAAAVSATDHELALLGDGFDDPRVALRLQRDVATAVTLRAAPSLVVARLDATFLADGWWPVQVTRRDGAVVDGPRLRLRRGAPPVCTTDGLAPMTTARRGPALVSYETSDGARHLLAIGGDGGHGSPARADLERATLRPDDGIDDWRIERQRLPAPRAGVGRAAFVHAEHVYLVGGNDSAGRPVDTVLRTAILDPARRPVARAEARHAVGAGLSPGVWLYRVAALRGDDPDLGAETLASEPVAARCDLRGAVRLRWTPVDGAIGYRVYRSRAPDGDASDLALLTTVDALALDDDGTLTPASSDTPLDPGSLGPWRTLDLRLNTARTGASVTLARGADGRTALLVIGGRGAALRDDIERSLWDDTRGEFGRFTVDPHRLLRAQEEPAVAVATPSDVPWLVAPPRVYISGGRDEAGAVTATETASLLDGGSLAVWATAPAHPRVSPHAIVLNGDLFTFGGASPDAARQGTLCRAHLDLYGQTPGFLCGGGALREPWRGGSIARVGELIYLVGGVTAADVATATVARCAP